MAARRAFYSLEFVLTADHPDLVWHILDTVYDMVDRGHIQLLGMFLTHARELSTRRLPQEHPLVKILQQLTKCDYQTQLGREQVCHLLRSAWLQNVDILSDHIGSLAPTHLWLYEQLIWDGRTSLRRDCELAKKRETMVAALTGLYQLADMDPRVSKLDRLRIMALMLEYTQMDLGDRHKAEELAIDLLNQTSFDKEASRSDARFHAYARRCWPGCRNMSEIGPGRKRISDMQSRRERLPTERAPTCGSYETCGCLPGTTRGREEVALRARL
ncbi:hypothetical protein J3459_007485 [Metarhizium acridum]|nr:hypothetical protein J3459_007485 [Metarhizium acridum]